MQRDDSKREIVMRQIGEAKVRQRGQLALPAQTRHRWGLDEGGLIGWVDLGDCVVLLPGALVQFRKEILANAEWVAARSGSGDPELANQ
jgi:bifunctional DNA-binding transcriptional regulator/antitoxin component of YhaV-PrlF toxin-antitoxin module